MRKTYYQIGKASPSDLGFYWSVWTEKHSTEDAELVEDGYDTQPLESLRSHVLATYQGVRKDRHSL